MMFEWKFTSCAPLNFGNNNNTQTIPFRVYICDMVFGPIEARAPAIYLCASNEFPIVFSARKGVTYIYIAGVRGDERLSMCMCGCVCG